MDTTPETTGRNTQKNTFSSNVLDKATVAEINRLRLSLDDFELKDIIGQGHFGEVMARSRMVQASLVLTSMCVSTYQVCVVRERSTGDVYAMKIMKKAHILQQADVSSHTL